MGSLMKGLTDFQQSKATAQNYNDNAKATIAQTVSTSQQQAREGMQTAANQEADYASSGVTLAGSPAQVAAQTRTLAQQTVNSTVKAGQAQAKMYRTNAIQAKQGGRNALLGGIVDTGIDIGKAVVGFI